MPLWFVEAADRLKNTTARLEHIARGNHPRDQTRLCGEVVASREAAARWLASVVSSPRHRSSA
jgi:hypothetical protein